MTREEKIREARRLKGSGLSSTGIGRTLGVSASTIRNWCLGGECEDCGTPITYDTAKYAPVRRCVDCQLAWRHDQKVWTRDAVIDAIRRYAAAHGRPPSAAAWLHVDPANNYPNRGSVYQSSGNLGSPFPTWADAIEAAGFPRPRRGHYARTAATRRRASESQRRRWVRRRETA